MTALILIDIQKGFLDPVWGRRNNFDLERNAGFLLSHWRMRNLPIYHIQHVSREPSSPLRPSHPGVDFIESLRPAETETIFQKHAHSAFIGTNLEADLRKNEIDRIVLAGFTSDHCVSTTARMGCDLGFNVTIASDAVATFDRPALDGRVHCADAVQAISLASLNKEFASVVTTNDILKEVLR